MAPDTPSAIAQDILAAIAIFLSLGTLIRQEWFQNLSSKKTTTVRLFGMWNTDAMRKSRSDLWSYFEDNPEPQIAIIRKNKELNLHYNAVSHFFVDIHSLMKNGYLDNQMTKTLLKGPAEGWLDFFRVINPDYDGDRTLKMKPVLTALAELIRE